MRKYLLLLILLGSVSCLRDYSTYLVGGTVTGLSGMVVLQNNGIDDLTMTADGSFTFSTPLLNGLTYSVTVLTQPTGQVCSVANGSGTVRRGNVTGVTVTCEAALGSATLIDVTPIIQTGVFPSYNSFRDQFLLTWWNFDEASIDFAIYDADGGIAVPYTLLFDTTITPLSEVFSCYNDHLDQYFVAWNEFNTASASFAILDAAGEVVQGVTTITGTHTPNGNVQCSFNSTDHQYFVTWVDGTNVMYFAIINEDGTEHMAETLLPNAGGVQAHGSNLSSSYSVADNEYFITWVGSDLNVYFAIYGADGTAVQAATAVPGFNGYGSAGSCYNSVNNEYFIPWYDGGGTTYFSIYNADGTVAVDAQEIPDFSSDINAGPVTCSYNSVQNNYFLTAITPGFGLTGIVYAILSDQGEIVIEPTAIANPSGLLTHKPVYSSFSEGSDRVFITWTADDSGAVFNGYFALYRFIP